MSEDLSIIPGTVPTRVIHGYLLASTAPRPIGFASTISKKGEHNLAPFSFFNVFSAKPPICIFSPARRVKDNTIKHTLENVYEVPEVVINMVSYEIVEQMNLASSDFDRGVSEFRKAGLTPISSDLIRPLRVKESPVNYECKVIEIKPLSNEAGAGQLIICEILKIHIHRNVLDEFENIDPHKIDLVARMGANYYCRASGEAVFEVEKPLDQPGIGIDQIPAYIRNSTVLSGNDLGKLGNIKAMPVNEDVILWLRENAKITEKIDSPTSLHLMAKEWLRTNRKEEAWKLLLAQPSLFK